MKTPIERLQATMAALRDPNGGCPWDLKQDHLSLIPYLLEETYEVVDALENGDDRELCEELGDLLMQIVFHAQIATEQNRFTFDDIAAAINDKLIRRHPHVFGDSQLQDDAELDAAWEQSKAAEKPASADSSLLDSVITALPALMRAQKLQRRAARVGFDWPDHHGPLAKIHEETAEIEAELQCNQPDQENLREEIGDLLFSVVNLARHFDIDAEDALRQANHKFSRRFQDVERCIADSGGDIHNADAAQMEQCWEKAKQAIASAKDHDSSCSASNMEASSDATEWLKGLKPLRFHVAEAGTPIEDAVIRITPSPQTGEPQPDTLVVTDSKGDAQVLIEEGNYNISIQSNYCHAPNGDSTVEHNNINVGTDNLTPITVAMSCFAHAIVGTVKDADTLDPVPGAKVEFEFGKNSGQFVLSDDDGSYSIGVSENIKNGLILVSHKGYKPAPIRFSSDDFSQGKKTVQKDVFLLSTTNLYTHIPVRDGERLYHLGNDRYPTDSFNRELQKDSDGLFIDLHFNITPTQLQNAEKLTLHLMSKGVQENVIESDVDINGKTFGILPASPSDGSFGSSTIAMDVDKLKLYTNKENTLHIESGQLSSLFGGDYDDFEIAGLYMEISAKRKPIYGETAP